MAKYSAKGHYIGQTATQYDKKRSKNAKWIREIELVGDLVSYFDKDSSILDVPLGTGRFVKSYKDNGHRVTGLDVSHDMLLQARKTVDGDGSARTSMIAGEAEHLPLRDNSIDYVVCIRLLNWVPRAVLENIIRDCHRVASKGMLIGIRMQRPMGSFEFIGRLALGIIPSSRNIARWKKKLGRYLKATKGVKSSDPEGYALHNEADVFALFSSLNVKVERSVEVDTRVSLVHCRFEPYFFYLVTNDNG